MTPRPLLPLALLALVVCALCIHVASASAPAAAAAADADADDDAPAAASGATVDTDHPAADLEPEQVPFSAYDFMQGEWEIYRHLLTPDGISYASSLPAVRWRLEKDNSSLASNLVGFAHQNGSSEALYLRLETHDTPAVGRILSGADEDHLDTLMAFGFSAVKGSIPVSAGVWTGVDTAGDSHASYVMQTFGNDRWTILVTPSGGRTLAQVATAQAGAKKNKRAAAHAADDDDLHIEGPASTAHPALAPSELGSARQILFVAHRVIKESEKSFFARYGSYIMLVGMLLVNVWMRSKQGSMAPGAGAAAQQVARARAQQQAGAGAGAGAVSAATARARAAAAQPAQIEDITEGDINVKKGN